MSQKSSGDLSVVNIYLTTVEPCLTLLFAYILSLTLINYTQLILKSAPHHIYIGIFIFNLHSKHNAFPSL